MTSSKCQQCGLVNPSNTPECKRCGFILIGGGTPGTRQDTDRKATDKKDELPGVRMAETLPRAVCSICGTNDGVEIRSLQRTYTPNWVWLFLPFGIIPAGIIGLAV